MFLRAGFNPAHERVGIWAMIMREGFRDWRRSQLIRFECGDLAWYGNPGLSWGSSRDLRFRNFYYPFDGYRFMEWRAWRSNVDTREEGGDAWKNGDPDPVRPPAPPKARRPQQRPWGQLALALN